MNIQTRKYSTYIRNHHLSINLNNDTKVLAIFPWAIYMLHLFKSINAL